MPIYEYQCTACDKEIEALQKISDAPLQKCPACGEPALKKKISAAAFRLKGGGWYETDFKTGDKKNLASGSDKTAATGATGAAGAAAKPSTPAAGGDKSST